MAPRRAGQDAEKGQHRLHPQFCSDPLAPQPGACLSLRGSPTYLPTQMAMLPPRCAPKKPPREKMEAMVDQSSVSTSGLSSVWYRSRQVSLRNLWMCWKDKAHWLNPTPPAPHPACDPHRAPCFAPRQWHVHRSLPHGPSGQLPPRSGTVLGEWALVHRAANTVCSTSSTATMNQPCPAGSPKRTPAGGGRRLSGKREARPCSWAGGVGTGVSTGQGGASAPATGKKSPPPPGTYLGGGVDDRHVVAILEGPANARCAGGQKECPRGELEEATRGHRT